MNSPTFFRIPMVIIICSIGSGLGSVFFITGGFGTETSTEVLDLNDPTSSCSRTTGSLPGDYGRVGHSINKDSDGRVILCGGFGTPTSCITTLTPMGPWTSHSHLTASRWGHSSVTSEGKLHLIAGYGGAGGIAETLDGNDWRQRRPLPYTLGIGSCTVKINDSAVFVTGGDNSLSKSAMWDPELDQWTIMADMDSERFGHGCGVIKRQGRTYVLVAGGYAANDVILRTSSLYDVDAKTWTPVGVMNQDRFDGQMLDGQFMAGGKDSNTTTHSLDTIERFDFGTKQWSNTQLKMKSARFGFAAVEVDQVTFC